MAKSKKKPDDDDDDDLQVNADADDADIEGAETEVDLDVEDAEDAGDADMEDADIETEAEADEVEEADVETADEEDDAGKDSEDGDDGDDESQDRTPSRPRPKLTKTTIAFLLLNWLAVPAFLYFAVVDHAARAQYRQGTLVNYIQIWGLPLKDEDNQPFANETRPRLVLSPNQLAEAVKKRTQPKNLKQFQGVDEPVPLRIRERDMTPEMLNDIFAYQGMSDPVKTLDEEIERLRRSVPAAIESAAKEAFDKFDTEAKKRAAIQQTLFAIAWNVKQVRELDKALAAAAGEELDKLLMEALQRRMYYDILAPLNVFRPGEFKDVKQYRIENLADLKAHSLDDIKGFFDKRLEHALKDKFDPEYHLGQFYSDEAPSPQAATRGSDEKREVIGFILFTLGQASKPTLGEKLINKGVERAQVVCGLHQFTDSSIRYVQALRVLEARVVDSIKADRDGFVFDLVKQAGKAITAGFGDDYEAQIDRLIRIVEDIDSAQKRLIDLTAQRDAARKTYNQRLQQRTGTLAKLLQARKLTKQSSDDLKDFEVQLHKALVELSFAAERNLELEAEIRAIETRFINNAAKKGGKRP